MAPRVSSVVPLINRTAAQNLEAFVEAGRFSRAFGTVPFDEPIWLVDVGDSTQPGGQIAGTLAFTREATARNASRSDGIPFAEPFCSFIKALVRLDEQARHKNVTGHRRTIAAARLLYRASERFGHDPRLMSGSTFSQAEAFLKDACNAEQYSPSTAYQLGIVLERIARTLTEAGIAGRRVDHRNSLPRPPNVRPLDGNDRRMTEDAALKALFTVSASKLSDVDRLMIRLIELLWCAPWRINEIIRLPVDCEVHQPKTANGVAVLDGDGRQVVNYGIRYSGSKGFLADIKWIPTAMVSVAQRAVREIREITETSRDVCRWMEMNPGRAWLPDPWRGASRDAYLTSADAARAIGMSRYNSFIQFAIDNNITGIAGKFRYGGLGFRQGDIEDALLRCLKPIAGQDGMKRSEYLFVITRNSLSSWKTALPPIVDIVNHAHVGGFLGGRCGVKSIFERLDLRAPDGQPYRLTSHQIRHLLNTIAAENGLGEYERARWSGRSDIKHNDAYDHETGYELAERARKLLDSDRMRGPIAMTFKRLPPVESSAFSLVQLATVHTTDIGLCFHDWGAAPCPHHGACASCRDCAIVKGDPVHRARVEILLQEEQITLARALTEVEDGTYGASNFVEHGHRMVAGYRSMLAIHDDPSIEDGTMVQLEPEPVREGLLHPSEPTV